MSEASLPSVEFFYVCIIWALPRTVMLCMFYVILSMREMAKKSNCSLLSPKTRCIPLVEFK